MTSPFNKIDSSDYYKTYFNNQNIMPEKLEKVYTTPRVVCELCNAELSVKSLRIHQLTNCGQRIRTDKAKLSTAITNIKKREYTDDNIRKALDLINKGYEVKDIIKETGFAEHHIWKIRNGLIFPIDNLTQQELEDKVSENLAKKYAKASNKQQNLDNIKIKKRSYDFNTAIQILNERIKGKSYAVLKEEFNISKDAVRRLCKGESKLIESEFENSDNISYQDYQNMIEEINK